KALKRLLALPSSVLFSIRRQFSLRDSRSRSVLAFGLPGGLFRFYLRIAHFLPHIDLAKATWERNLSAATKGPHSSGLKSVLGSNERIRALSDSHHPRQSLRAQNSGRPRVPPTTSASLLSLHSNLLLPGSTRSRSGSTSKPLGK